MSDTLKKLEEARRREAEAKAEVERLTKMAEEEAKVTLGFVPTLGMKYFFLTYTGEISWYTYDGDPVDVSICEHGVYETVAEAKIESLFRRRRRYGARVTVAEARDLWYWNIFYQKAYPLADATHEFVTMQLLAGNAFHTKEQAEKYGRDVFPQIIEELLGK